MFRAVLAACAVLVFAVGCSSTTTPSARWVDAAATAMAHEVQPPATPGLTLATDDGTVVYGPGVRPIVTP